MNPIPPVCRLSRRVRAVSLPGVVRHFLAGLCLLGGVLAQDVEAALSATGVVHVDGQLLALGRDYRARFDDGGMQFEPALGRGVQDTQTWRYEWDSARRGSVVLFERGADAVPAAADEVAKEVRYGHAPGFTEVYAARPDGVEQSFVFARRPAGVGDLVVRGRIRCSLPLADNDERAGLHYDLPGIGGVRVGGVTGVDANGATAAGTVRLDGDHVEYTLPAAFVDHAAYPLVLDPLIGAAFAIGDGVGLDTLPSVAFDQSSLRWYVTWIVVVSASSMELRGQRLSSTGSLVGSVSVVWSGPLDTTHAPVVVNVNGSDRFLVTWLSPNTQQASIRCRSVDAATGAMSATKLVISTNFGQFRFGVGGDLRANGDTAVVAFSNRSNSAPDSRLVEAARVQVPSTGDPVIGTRQVLTSEVTTTSWHHSDVAVSRTGGPTGRWLVTWARRNYSVSGAVMNEIGTICVPETPLFGGGLFANVQSIACAAADGDRFVLAYHVSAALSGNENLWALPITVQGVCPTTMSTGSAALVATDLGGDSRPSIDFARDKYLTAWRRIGSGGTFEVVVKGLEPVTCADCGAVHPVEPGAGAQDWPAIASRYSAGDTVSDTGMVVWTDSTIRGRRVEATGGGAATDLGGACGGVPGTNVNGASGQAVIGNLDFALTLSSPSAPVLAVVVGLSNPTLPCGPCTLVPAPDIVMAGGGPAPLPLPCDLSYLGLVFYTQWLTLQPGGCPVLPDFGLSNALRFTVGE